MLVVSELSRLRKVTAYIDELLNSLDPELVPFQIWAEFQQQANNISSSLTAFNQDKNIAHLQNSNSYSDNLMQIVRPYVLIKGKLGKGLRNAAVKYSSALLEMSELLKQQINDSANEATKVVKKIEELSVQVESRVAKMEEKVDLVIGNEDEELEGIFYEIESKNTAATKITDELTNFHAKIFEGTDEQDAISLQIEHTLDDVQVLNTESSELLTKLKQYEKSFGDLEQNIFGANESDGTKTAGLKSEIEALKLESTRQNKDQEKIFNALSKQIEGLVPGATVVGLATASNDMRQEFIKPRERATWMFYASLGALVAIAFVSNVQSISKSGIEFYSFDSAFDVLKNFATKIPLIAPVVWFAYFTAQRRSEFHRLEQEYAHKTTLSKSYLSFKQQVESLGANGDGLMSLLMQKSIESLASNPSETLDKKMGTKCHRMKY